jgi:formate dehydrogenase subunit gamma
MTARTEPAATTAVAVAEALARWRDEPGALLPILHQVQEAVGYIPASAVPLIAEGLNLSRAEVHGVVTYYHHFHTEPPGRHAIQICQAEACRAMGAQALMAHAQARLGCAAHGKSADGRYSLEPVYCLGLCAMSPAIVVDEQPHARVNVQRFDKLVQSLEAQA